MQLSEEFILERAHKLVGGSLRVWFAPDFPKGAVRRVREACGLALADDDPILMLQDNQLFGGWSSGIVVTRARLVFYQPFDKLEFLPWEHIVKDAVRAASGQLHLMGATIEVSSCDARCIAELIHALVAQASVPDDPYRARAVIESEEQSMARRVRRHLGLNPRLYHAPLIPGAKEHRARKVQGANLPADEPLVALHDDTVWNGGKNGFMLTARRVCWRCLHEEPVSFLWHELPADKIELVKKDFLRVGDKELKSIRVETEAVLPGLCRLLQELALPAP